MCCIEDEFEGLNTASVQQVAVLGLEVALPRETLEIEFLRLFITDPSLGSSG